jgi:DNA-binding transcriptional MerR regulator
MTDEGTVKRLISDIPFRKALLEDPNVILALKKCASPCFPPAATVEQVRELSRILKNKSPEELAKIREFIYQNRSDAKKLDDAIKQLNTTYDQVIKDVKTPLLEIPKKFKDVEAIEQNLKQIVGFGVPVEQVNKIMKNFVQHQFGNSSDFIYLMRKMLELEKNVPMKNIGKILEGLESTNKDICRAAEHLMDEIARFPGAKGYEKELFTYPGLQKADKLLDIYDLRDLHSLMRTRWAEGFINSLYEVQSKVKGSPAEIITLAKKAGSDGLGDLERLRRILERLKSEGVTVGEAMAAIKESDEFAANLASAMTDINGGFDSIAKQLWGKGASVKNGVVEVAPELAKGRKGAGKAAIQQIMGANGSLADELVEKFIVAGDKINYANWGVVRGVILKAENVADSIKSNLIGELWNRINLVELRKAGFDDITREVELIIGGGTARADAVAIRGDELIVLEFKSMNGELTAGQKIVYPFLEAGNFAAVKVNNERLAKLFKDLKMKRSYKLVAEKDFLK